MAASVKHITVYLPRHTSLRTLVYDKAKSSNVI